METRFKSLCGMIDRGMHEHPAYLSSITQKDARIKAYNPTPAAGSSNAKV